MSQYDPRAPGQHLNARLTTPGYPMQPGHAPQPQLIAKPGQQPPSIQFRSSTRPNVNPVLHNLPTFDLSKANLAEVKRRADLALEQDRHAQINREPTYARNTAPSWHQNNYSGETRQLGVVGQGWVERTGVTGYGQQQQQKYRPASLLNQNNYYTSMERRDSQQLSLPKDSTQLTGGKNMSSLAQSRSDDRLPRMVKSVYPDPSKQHFQRQSSNKLQNNNPVSPYISNRSSISQPKTYQRSAEPIRSYQPAEQTYKYNPGTSSTAESTYKYTSAIETTSKYTTAPIPADNPLAQPNNYKQVKSASQPTPHQPSNIVAEDNSQLMCKIKALEQQNQGLRDKIQSATDSREYYSQQLSKQYDNVSKMEQEWQGKIHELAEMHQEQVESIKKRVQRKQEQFQLLFRQLNQRHEEERKSVQKRVDEKKAKIDSLVIEIGNQSNLQLLTQGNQSEHSQADWEKVRAQVQEKQRAIAELQGELASRDQQVNQLNKCYEQLRQQIAQLRSFKEKAQKERYASFDPILMTQMQSISELRQKIDKLLETCQQLEAKIIISERQHDAMNNRKKMMEVNFNNEMSIEDEKSRYSLGSKDLQVMQLNKKMHGLEEKYKSVLAEVRARDEFFQQRLVGRPEPLSPSKRYIDEILAQFEAAFANSRQQELEAQLAEVSRKLEQYQRYA